ncbi:MAG: hypothetical protein P8X94_08465 [Woeseiaceae bacterium]
MKYLLALLLGMIVGAIFLALALLYNPFAANRGASPLSVTDADVIALAYSAVPTESILYTNDGESMHAPRPDKVLQLWEAPIRQTSAMVSLLDNARGEPAGIGVKLSSKSESSRPFQGAAIMDSAWYIYLPGRGSLFVAQQENYWPFLRQVAFPAWRSSANTWRGKWFGDMTSGPGALGTAAVRGASGSLRGRDMEAVESLSVLAFSSDQGLVSAEGRLLIAFPEPLSAAANPVR